MVVSVPGSWQQASKALVDASVMRAQQQSLVFTQWLWRAPGRGLVPERPGHDEKLGIFGPLNSSREGRGLEMGLMTPSQGSGSFRVVHPNSMGTLQPSPWASLPSSGCSSESFVTSFNELVNVKLVSAWVLRAVLGHVRVQGGSWESCQTEVGVHLTTPSFWTKANV